MEVLNISYLRELPRQSQRKIKINILKGLQIYFQVENVVFIVIIIYQYMFLKLLKHKYKQIKYSLRANSYVHVDFSIITKNRII